MAELVLYHSPGACSQVTRIALEEAGLEYSVRLIDMSLNEQASAEYAQVSPLAKVPVLLIDGVPLSENMAILTYIAELRPDAGLFPADASPLGVARRVSGLSFCSATLHPICRGLVAPQRLTDGDVEGVRSRSTALANKNFAYAEKRLAESGWWLGEWSIIDAYLGWAVALARRGGFDLAPFPLLDGLGARLLERPSVQRTADLDGQATEAMAARRAAAE